MPRRVAGETLGVEQPGPLHILHIVSHNHDAVTAHRQAVSAANRDLGLYYAFVRAFTAVHHRQVFSCSPADIAADAVLEAPRRAAPARKVQMTSGPQRRLPLAA